MANPYDRYRKVQQTGATGPARLIAMFDGMLRNLEAARKDQVLVGEGPAEEKAVHAAGVRRRLKRVLKGVQELQRALETGTWEGAESLLTLYQYISHRLIDAVEDPAALAEATGMLSDLRKAWATAARQVPPPPRGESRSTMA